MALTVGPGVQAGTPRTAALLTRWRAALAIPSVFAIAALALSYLVQPTYTATASFAPETRENAFAGVSGLSNLALQVGLSGPSPSRSPQFYGDVLLSRRVLEAVATARIAIDDGHGRTDSVELLGRLVRPGVPPADQLERATARLRSATAVNVNPRTGVVEVRVTLPSPSLAAQAARQFILAASQFNMNSRRSQAGERRRFAQEWLRDAEDSLAAAEAAERSFLEHNARYVGSPRLEFEHDRLHRRVTAAQELANTLHQEYESARLDEVNDTPVLTIIDSASAPRRPSGPSRGAALLGGLMLGGVLVLGWFVLDQYLTTMAATDPHTFEHFRGLARALAWPFGGAGGLAGPKP